MMDNVVKRHLRGEGRLWSVFWIWGVLGSWILFGVFYAALQAIGITWTLFFASAVVMLPYTTWILTSVWMCARNVGNPMWGDAARFLTFIWALNVGAVGGWMLSGLVLS